MVQKSVFGSENVFLIYSTLYTKKIRAGPALGGPVFEHLPGCLTWGGFYPGALTKSLSVAPLHAGRYLEFGWLISPPATTSH